MLKLFYRTVFGQGDTTLTLIKDGRENQKLFMEPSETKDEVFIDWLTTTHSNYFEKIFDESDKKLKGVKDKSTGLFYKAGQTPPIKVVHPLTKKVYSYK